MVKFPTQPIFNSDFNFYALNPSAGSGIEDYLDRFFRYLTQSASFHSTIVFRPCLAHFCDKVIREFVANVEDLLVWNWGLVECSVWNAGGARFEHGRCQVRTQPIATVVMITSHN